MLNQTLPLFDPVEKNDPGEMPGPDSLLDYDTVIVGFSGGKDSIACVLHLIETGVPRERIELWHHCIDGYGNSDPLMDWPVTEDYCRKFAAALNLKILFSWRDGGFKGELLRENALTRPAYFETPDGLKKAGGVRGKPNTRRKFPQTSASLVTRWCSSSLKIDVCSIAIANQERFQNSKTLLVTGERAQESTARARYNVFEPDRTDARNSARLRRHVDRCRPVHHWNEEAVWEIIERWRINPHPGYRLGWGRLSCLCCIFASRHQWASIRKIAPDRFERIAQYEEEFGVTIHRKKSVREQACQGNAYANMDPKIVDLAMSTTFDEEILLDNWTLPSGAYGENAGPV